jgi:hypothetical protein
MVNYFLEIGYLEPNSYGLAAKTDAGAQITSAQIHRLIRTSFWESEALQTFLIPSKAPDDCKLSTLCEIPLYSGGAEERRLGRMEQHAGSLPPRRRVKKDPVPFSGGGAESKARGQTEPGGKDKG